MGVGAAVFLGFGVLVGAAVGAAARSARSARATGRSGNGCLANAASACAVTHTGVCLLVREYRTAPPGAVSAAQVGERRA